MTVIEQDIVARLRHALIGVAQEITQKTIRDAIAEIERLRLDLAKRGRMKS